MNAAEVADKLGLQSYRYNLLKFNIRVTTAKSSNQMLIVLEPDDGSFTRQLRSLEVTACMKVWTGSGLFS